jgi:hypothetical protein
MMGIFKAFKNGFLVTGKRSKLLVYLWVINMAFALMLAVPFFQFVSRGLSRSLMGDAVLQNVNFLWIGDVIYQSMEKGYLLGNGIMIPIILFSILYIFLNGGIMGRLVENDSESITLKTFFSDCGCFFWRFFKLFLLSIPVYAVVLGIINGITGAILNIFTQNAATAWPAFIAKNVKMVVFLLSFSLVNMLFDYAKIGLVVRQETGVLKEWWNSVKFVLSHFWRTWGLYLFIGVLFLIVSLFYLEIERLIPGQSMLLILLLFLWHQLYMVAKLWFKLNFFASQIELYRYYVQ